MENDPIYRQEMFRRGNVAIAKMIPVDGNVETQYHFKSSGSTPLFDPNGNQVGNLQFEFDIPATTIAEAFDGWKVAHDIGVDKAKKQFEADQRIKQQVGIQQQLAIQRQHRIQAAINGKGILVP